MCDKFEATNPQADAADDPRQLQLKGPRVEGNVAGPWRGARPRTGGDAS